jgi:hypothetical protein
MYRVLPGLLTWTQKIVVDAVLAKLKMIFNTSVHRGKGGKQKYIMAIESGLNGGCCGPITFAQSENLLDWEVLDPSVYNYGRSPAKYTGDPTIRFVEPYYYMMHSEVTDERWVIGGTGKINGTFCVPFYSKTMILPRQARDKHRENSTKSTALFRLRRLYRA